MRHRPPGVGREVGRGVLVDVSSVSARECAFRVVTFSGGRRSMLEDVVYDDDARGCHTREVYFDFVAR